MKKSLLFGFMVAIVGVAFIGCGDSPKSIEYYKQHRAEADKRAKECDAMHFLYSAVSRNTKIDCCNATNVSLSGK